METLPARSAAPGRSSSADNPTRSTCSRRPTSPAWCRAPWPPLSPVPHGNGVGAAVLAVGRQHRRRGGFQQRPHRFDPSSAHPWKPSGDQPQRDGWERAKRTRPPGSRRYPRSACVVRARTRTPAGRCLRVRGCPASSTASEWSGSPRWLPATRWLSGGDMDHAVWQFAGAQPAGSPMDHAVTVSADEDQITAHQGFRQTQLASVPSAEGCMGSCGLDDVQDRLGGGGGVSSSATSPRGWRRR